MMIDSQRDISQKIHLFANFLEPLSIIYRENTIYRIFKIADLKTVPPTTWAVQFLGFMENLYLQLKYSRTQKNQTFSE